jgi:hypothetical protein
MLRTAFRPVFALLAVFAAMLSVSAQETAAPAPSSAADALAFFRVVHLDTTGIGLNLYIDSAPVAMNAEGDPRIVPGTAYGYQPARPGTYTIGFTAHNSFTALIGPSEIGFAAGHRYTFALVGRYSDETLRLLFLDETAMLADAGFDAAAQSATLYVNNAPAPIAVAWADEAQVSALSPGRAFVAVRPALAVGGRFSIAAESGERLDVERPADPAGAFTLAAVIPLETAADADAAETTPSPDAAPSATAEAAATPEPPVPAAIGLLIPSNYLGALTLTDGGDVVFDGEGRFTSAFTLAPAGERRRFTLALAEETAVSITLAPGTESGQAEDGRTIDPYLRIYDADAARPLAENDTRDGAVLPASAGGVLTLPAGRYFIDAAAARDLFGGPMVLTLELP